MLNSIQEVKQKGETKMVVTNTEKFKTILDKVSETDNKAVILLVEDEVLNENTNLREYNFFFITIQGVNFLVVLESWCSESEAVDWIADYLENALEEDTHPYHGFASVIITQDIFDWCPELRWEHPDLSDDQIVEGILNGDIPSDHTMGIGNAGYWYTPYEWRIQKL